MMAEPESEMSADESILLLSGGLDSTALAAILRPARCLTIDYGQRPAVAESRAAAAICTALGLRLEHIRLDLSELGGGLLRGDEPIPGAPSPEWWPYRNQFLVTAAASVAFRHGLREVIVGSVRGDGERHLDGTAQFYELLDGLVAMQEGGVRVIAPAIHETSAELLERSGIGDDIIGWTVSCHRSNLPCGDCPGCWKRGGVLAATGHLQAPTTHRGPW